MHLKVLSPEDANKLSSRLNNGNWLVLYYANWCGHCQHMKPEWEKTVNNLKNNKNLNIAEVESESMQHMNPKVEIMGFPSLKMYNNGKQQAEFEGQRTADVIEEFALKHCSQSKTNKISKKKSKKTKKNKKLKSRKH